MNESDTENELWIKIYDENMEKIKIEPPIKDVFFKKSKKVKQDEKIQTLDSFKKEYIKMMQQFY